MVAGGSGERKWGIVVRCKISVTENEEYPRSAVQASARGAVHLEFVQRADLVLLFC